MPLHHILVLNLSLILLPFFIYGQYLLLVLYYYRISIFFPQKEYILYLEMQFVAETFIVSSCILNKSMYLQTRRKCNKYYYWFKQVILYHKFFSSSQCNFLSQPFSRVLCYLHMLILPLLKKPFSTVKYIKIHTKTHKLLMLSLNVIRHNIF